MRVQNCSFFQPSFAADKEKINKQTGEYLDPLMHWPLRGCAFTNEIGEALRPLIGEYATLSWAPALLYIGADVYDKYKNNETEFSPNSERCLKQAIFQGLASIFLPLVAVKSGQKVFSQFGRFTKEKITVNNKERINKVAQEFVANGKMHAYSGKDVECKNDFLEIIKNKIEYKRQSTSNNNILKKVWYSIGDSIDKITNTNQNKHIEDYAENQIQSLIDMRKRIIKPSNDDKNTKWYKEYSSLKKMGQTQNVAIKSTLNNKLENEMLIGKAIRTVGGFAALAVSINPIDRFVENVLIGKVINSSIEKYKTSRNGN